jgi:hypothetical protein
MSGFVEGIDRSQRAMLDDYVAEDNPIRAVDAVVEGLDLGKHGFGRVVPLEQGLPGYHPATLHRRLGGAIVRPDLLISLETSQSLKDPMACHRRR